MIVFIVPLKSPQTSTSWVQVCRLFERCVKSICNQTSPHFRVIVVCHEKPKLDFTHPHITYIDVDFPVPPPSNLARTLDKARKIVTGLIVARQFHPAYAMNVDADDCVSKYLAEFVSQQRQSNGWFINQGYQYEDGSSSIELRKRNFDKLCGTSTILNYQLYNLPKHITSDHLEQYYIGHHKIRDRMAANAKPLTSFPSPGAVYIRAKNQENISAQESLFEQLRSNPKKLVNPVKRTVLKLFNTQHLTDSIRDEFGIYPID